MILALNLTAKRAGCGKGSKTIFFVNKKEAKKTLLIYTVLLPPPVAQ
jgi:hypothetical protein